MRDTVRQVRAPDAVFAPRREEGPHPALPGLFSAYGRYIPRLAGWRH